MKSPTQHDRPVDVEERAAPRTFGMMQYAQWQSQPSCTLTNPRVRVPDQVLVAR